MKKLILIIGVALFATTASANGKKPSAFGASLKPSPNLTLFGQKISWPIPSLCLGAKAGVTPDASVSSDGVRLKIPYLSLELPFPSLFLGTKTNRVHLKLGEISRSKQK